MGFFSPWMFLFAITLPIIVILWLLKRRRQDRTVSSVYLWQQVLKDVRANAPWQRFRKNLLMFLQLLAAALFALALARPFLPAALGGDTHILALVDVSGSMLTREAGGTRLDLAKQRAGELAGALGGRDRMTVVTVGRLPNVVAASAQRPAAEAAVAAIQPTHEVADWGQAFSLAASLSREVKGLRAVLFTDSPIAADALEKLPLPAEVVVVGGAADNVALQSLSLRQGTDGSVGGLAHVVNFGRQPVEADVELYGDGRLVDVRRAALSAGQAADVVWRDLPRDVRTFEARLVGLSPGQDALAADNAAWGVVGSSRRVKVLLVSRSNRFVERALLLRPGVEVVRATPDNYAAGDFQLYIFDGWLPAELPKAAMIVFNPPRENPIVPGDRVVEVGPLRPGAEAGDLLAYVQLEEVAVARSRILAPPTWARSVISTPETPLLLFGTFEGRPVAVFGFDVHESNFPLRTGFPVLIQNLLGALVPPDPTPPMALAGEQVPLALDPLIEEASIVTPDGRRARVAPPLPAPPWVDTDRLGVYRVVQKLPGEERTSYFAVNFPAAESAPAGVVSVAGGETASGARTAERLVSREIWLWGAVAALVILVVEWWVYSRVA